jgi:hypothetical protein
VDEVEISAQIVNAAGVEVKRRTLGRSVDVTWSYDGDDVAVEFDPPVSRTDEWGVARTIARWPQRKRVPSGHILATTSDL